jgi:hypothetical protein
MFLYLFELFGTLGAVTAAVTAVTAAGVTVAMPAAAAEKVLIALRTTDHISTAAGLKYRGHLDEFSAQA